MKPIDLLEEVKARFPMLLHSEDAKLKALLRKAIGVYQDLAGFMAKTRIQSGQAPNGVFPLPERFSTRVSVMDASDSFIVSEVWGKELELKLSGGERYPFTLVYLENLRDADLNEISLPDNSITLISDYLELLIASPNSERLRRVAIAGKLDTSDIPTETDLAQRRVEMEDRIKTSQAMLPSFSFM